MVRKGRRTEDRCITATHFVRDNIERARISPIQCGRMNQKKDTHESSETDDVRLAHLPSNFFSEAFKGLNKNKVSDLVGGNESFGDPPGRRLVQRLAFPSRQVCQWASGSGPSR